MYMVAKGNLPLDCNTQYLKWTLNIIVAALFTVLYQELAGHRNSAQKFWHVCGIKLFPSTPLRAYSRCFQ